MPDHSRPNHRQPLTFTEAAYHYNQAGETFAIACPACGHDSARIRRGTSGDSPKVVCDDGCPPGRIIAALIVAIRSEPSQGQS